MMCAREEPQDCVHGGAVVCSLRGRVAPAAGKLKRGDPWVRTRGLVVAPTEDG